VIGLRPHVADDRLLARYVAERTGDPIDTADAAHLQDCSACTARYMDLLRFMDDLRSEADAEADAWFPEARLQAARRQIARRLEHLGQMARVITFPQGRASASVRRSIPRPALRWVAGAAAAGLLVGVALGTYTDRVAAGRLSATTPAGAVAGVAPTLASVPEPPPPTFLDEEAFLQEVELASIGLRTRALMPIDAFTPSVREVSAQLR
jgi:anti-sigma factor RsiW